MSKIKGPKLLFCKRSLILYNFRFLKLKNKGPHVYNMVKTNSKILIRSWMYRCWILDPKKYENFSISLIWKFLNLILEYESYSYAPFFDFVLIRHLHNFGKVGVLILKPLGQFDFFNYLIVSGVHLISQSQTARVYPPLSEI